MKKKTLCSVLCAAALFTLSSAATVFAAGWTTNYNGQWVYLDEDGDMVYDEWRRDAGGNYFYHLGDNGIMETNTLVDGSYYVGADGVMVRNSWQQIRDNDWDGGVYWYYFGDTGKAVENGWKTIDGQRYFFEDCKLKTGWLTTNDATFYFDENGYMTTGWQYLYPDTDEWSDRHWFYFSNTGKMISGKEQRIDGSYYIFDTQGRMLSGWVNPSNLTCSYFDNLRDGKNIDGLRYYTSSGRRLDGWYFTMTPDGYDEGWYFFREGRAYNPNFKTTKLDDNYCVAKIGDKVYCFDKSGLMVTDLVETSDGRLFYFESDGRMATGNITIDGEKFYMETNGQLGNVGSAYTGVKNGYLYSNGARVSAEEGTRYEIKVVDNKKYLVSESGKIKTSGTVKDAYGTSYTVQKDNNGGYKITMN